MTDDAGGVRWDDAEGLRADLAAARVVRRVLDLRLDRLGCSDECKANYGRSLADPFTYADLWAAVHPDDRDRLRAALRTAVDARAGLDIEYRAVCRAGRRSGLMSAGGRRTTRPACRCP